MRLDLQPLTDRIYESARYDDIDYAVPPEPPLDPDDEAWANVLLASRGLRPRP